ncbi:MAG: enoyl-CoA hydratase/isomerase family protein [Tepidiphilus sp.]|nr:enoyl-CoA hydratase/isomerase family protein [Tepidiphilus sp.]
MAQAVLWEVVDGIGRLELNRPESLNALSFDMMEALDAASAALVQRPDLRVLVVSGRGGHFMAGGDIRDFSRLLDRTPGERRETFRTAIEQRVNPVVERLSRVPCPVVAKVSGACAGFGMSLMLACDLAIASSDAVFTTAYAMLGLPADGGLSYFLPRAVGSRRAAELFLLSERFDAQRALELGIVNRVVAPEALDAEVEALAARLAAGPSYAYGRIRSLLADSLEQSLEAQLLAEAEAFGDCSATEDFVEGIEAFLAKRKPRFRGR